MKETFAEPTLAEPTLAEPTLRMLTFAMPTLWKPTLKEPTLAEPTLEMPPLEEPTLKEPTLAEPTLAEPGGSLPPVCGFVFTAIKPAQRFAYSLMRPLPGAQSQGRAGQRIHATVGHNQKQKGASPEHPSALGN